MLWSATPGRATEPPGASSDTRERLQQKAEQLQRSLSEQQADLERTRRQAIDVSNALENAGRKLQRHRRRAAALKTEIAELDQEIASTREAREDLQRRIRTQQAHLARRLVALYKINRLGTWNLLASADSVVEAVKRKAALEQILAHDEQDRQRLVEQYTELEGLQSRLESQLEAKRTRMEEYAQQHAAARRQQTRREELLARIQKEHETQLAVLESLREAAQTLDQKLAELSRQASPYPSLGLSPPGPPISESKGLLIFPVNGKIIQRYGPYRHPRLNIPGFRYGIEIAADRGEPVRAVYAGTILYASWFKGYGNLVVIDHGDHFYTVYAHLEDVFKSVDNRVAAGEVIATVGDSGALGVTGLYFELRHYDRSLDPLAWLRPG